MQQAPSAQARIEAWADGAQQVKTGMRIIPRARFLFLTLYLIFDNDR